MNKSQKANLKKEVGLMESCQKPDQPYHQSTSNINDILLTPEDYPPRLRDYANHIQYVHNLIVKKMREREEFSNDYYDHFIKIHNDRVLMD